LDFELEERLYGFAWWPAGELRVTFGNVIIKDIGTLELAYKMFDVLRERFHEIKRRENIKRFGHPSECKYISRRILPHGLDSDIFEINMA